MLATIDNANGNSRLEILEKRMIELCADIWKIEGQLGDPARCDPISGKLLEPNEYLQWRGKALHALRVKKQQQAIVSMQIKQLRRESYQMRPRSLLIAILNSLPAEEIHRLEGYSQLTYQAVQLWKQHKETEVNANDLSTTATN